MTRFLITYPGLIPSVLLCGQIQLTYLANLGKIEVRSLSRQEIKSEDCGWADIIWMIRSDSEFDVHIAKKMKQAGKYVIYAMDDDLLNVPINISSGSFYAQRSIKENISELLQICDFFVSPSAKLREIYAPHKSLNIEEPSCCIHKKANYSNKIVRIGFAGSIDRGTDIDQLLVEVIEHLIRKFGDLISIEFFGAKPNLAERFHLKSYPYCDNYEEYQNLMVKLNWDIGLAPMPETKFHECKHYNKFIEYAGHGIIGVFSETLPYTQVILDGKNGFLCPNEPTAWIKVLTYLIENYKVREKISHEVQEQARTKFSVETTASDLEQSLGDLMVFTSLSHSPIRLPFFMLLKLFMNRFFYGLRRYGLHMPVIATKKLIIYMKKKRRDKNK